MYWRHLSALSLITCVSSASATYAAEPSRAPSHQRASSWRTVVIPAAHSRLAPTAAAPVDGWKPIATASISRTTPSAAPAKPLTGVAHGLSGLASFYWQGQKTATGEIFNPADMTAAHRTLPFGTKVRVTHTASGRSVVVRINDRGPFKAGRVIDLSKAAAERLQMTAVGLAAVTLEVVQ